MIKILIISYFYPPCNLTAANRVASWIRYLPDDEIFPSVITRSWQHEIKSEADISRASGNEIIHEKHADSEVYRVPHKPNLRDRLLVKNRLPFFRRFLSLCEQILQNWVIKFIPCYPLYKQAVRLLDRQNYDVLIISGNPFQQFFFGYKLTKKYNIPWIADYRDDWTTTELHEHSSILTRLVKRLEKKSEKKWVGTASYVTSVSPYYVSKITNLTNTKGESLYNGFDDDFQPENKADLSTSKTFRILYNGTLYPTQNIDIFAEGFLRACRILSKEGIDLKLQFPGLAYKRDQSERVKKSFLECVDHLHITERIPREKVLKMQSDAHALVMFSHNNIRGIPSSKMYEYLAYKKPIILSPGDDDILEEMIITSNSGRVCNSSDLVCNFILELSKAYRSEKIYEMFDYNHEKYKRSIQSKKLAKLIKNLAYEDF
ncbi:MAG: glycosyltransferase [Bacteroidota bacterium]